MKKLYKYLTLVMISSCFALASCSDKYDSFVGSDEFLTTPSAVSNVSYESLPGAIALKWDVPADSNYYFLRVSYYDHLTEKNVSRICSAQRDTMVISSTRAKFGDYNFTFQTFNSKNEGGEIQTLQAKSGIAPSYELISNAKVQLVESQLSTNAQEPSEGHIRNLIDGNAGTFFHTRWSSPQMDLPHFIDIALNEELTNFSFYYQNRNGSQVGPRELEILIGNDGENWESIKILSAGLPSGSKEEYHSDVVRNTTPFKYLRFSINKTYGDKKYFNLAEFVLYNTEITVVDPEKE